MIRGQYSGNGNGFLRATSRPLISRLNPASIYALAVSAPVVVLTFAGAWVARDEFELVMLGWVLLVAVAELLPVPASRDIHVSIGFTLLTAVALLYSPVWAAAIALIGSTDTSEIRRQTSVLKAVFNRSQVALAVFLASHTFHALAIDGVGKDPIYLVVLATLAASFVDYVTNLTLVIIGTSLIYRTSMFSLVRQFPRVREFLISYAALSLIGAVLAELFVGLHPLHLWAVAIVFAPVLFASQMFFVPMP